MHLVAFREELFDSTWYPSASKKKTYNIAPRLYDPRKLPVFVSACQLTVRQFELKAVARIGSAGADFTAERRLRVVLCGNCLLPARVQQRTLDAVQSARHAGS